MLKSFVKDYINHEVFSEIIEIAALDESRFIAVWSTPNRFTTSTFATAKDLNDFLKDLENSVEVHEIFKLDYKGNEVQVFRQRK